MKPQGLRQLSSNTCQFDKRNQARHDGSVVKKSFTTADDDMLF